MGSFLDALGITHEHGLIADEDVKPPEAGQLQTAARAIAASYPAEDVALYLSTLVWQDPDTWGALAEIPEVRAEGSGLGTGDSAPEMGNPEPGSENRS